MLWLAMAMQAASGSAAPADDRLHAVQPCPPVPPGGDVVVCGKVDPDQYRVKPLPDRWQGDAKALPTAAVTLPGVGRLSAETEEGSVGGFHTNRIMMRLRIPF